MAEIIEIRDGLIVTAEERAILVELQREIAEPARQVAAAQRVIDGATKRAVERLRALRPEATSAGAAS